MRRGLITLFVLGLFVGAGGESIAFAKSPKPKAQAVPACTLVAMSDLAPLGIPFQSGVTQTGLCTYNTFDGKVKADGEIEIETASYKKAGEAKKGFDAFVAAKQTQGATVTPLTGVGTKAVTTTQGIGAGTIVLQGTNWVAVTEIVEGPAAAGATPDFVTGLAKTALSRL